MSNIVPLFEDEINSLSWAARGILAYLITRESGDTRFTVNELIEAGKFGREGVLSVLHELEIEGYVLRYNVRYENGKFGGTQWSLNCEDL